MKKHTSTRKLTAYNTLCDHAHKDKASLELFVGSNVRDGARPLEAIRLNPTDGQALTERIYKGDLDAAAKRLDQRAF